MHKFQMTVELLEREAAMAEVLALRQPTGEGWRDVCNKAIDDLFEEVKALCAAAKADGWDSMVEGAPGWGPERQREARRLDIMRATWRWAMTQFDEGWEAFTIDGVNGLLYSHDGAPWPRMARFMPLTVEEREAILAADVQKWEATATPDDLAAWEALADAEMADPPQVRDIIVETTTPLGGALVKAKWGRGYAEWLAIHSYRRPGARAA